MKKLLALVITSLMLFSTIGIALADDSIFLDTPKSSVSENKPSISLVDSVPEEKTPAKEVHVDQSPPRRGGSDDKEVIKEEVKEPGFTGKVTLLTSSESVSLKYENGRIVSKAVYNLAAPSLDEVPYVNLRIHDDYPQGGDYVFFCEAYNFIPELYDWHYGDGDKLLNIKNDNTFHRYDKDGEYEVSCTAKNDKESYSDTITIIVDVVEGEEEEPSIKLIAPQTNELFQDNDIEFKFVVDHNKKIESCTIHLSGSLNYPFLGKIKQTFNGLAMTALDTTANSMNILLTPGAYKAQVTCIDSKGNEGTSNSIMFTVQGFAAEEIAPEEILSDNRRGGGCLTTWTCTEWRTEGDQEVRTCTHVIDEKHHCVVGEKPAETRPVQNLLNQENLEIEDQNENIFSRITGAVIGANGEPTLVGAFVLALIIAVLYIAVIFNRR